jgi:NADH:ubiquinone oxidoreductase subunit 6 (subunit J)
MLCAGTALFGVFFFLTLFMQAVWGYSALRTGVAYLPMMAAIMAMSGASVRLVPRIGARPLLLAGSVTAAGGMFWLSRISEHSHYTGGLLGPTMVAGAGLGMLFMPLSVTALSRVRADVAGVASSLLNTGQQIGGSIGLAVLGTVAWTSVANSIRSQAAAAARTAAKTGHPAPPAAAGQPSAAIYQHALATGFSRGFEVAAAILLIALIVAIAAIRVRRADLDGMQGQ